MSFGLDQYTAKQMAALQATSLAKAGNRSAPGGTSVPYFGGMQSSAHPRPDAPQDPRHSLGALSDFQQPGHHPNPNNMQASNAAMQHMLQMQKKRQWLQGLANVMNQRNAPLPPPLTGVPYPATFDPTHSLWKNLDIVDIGVVRLASKEVDLYKLWAVVLQAGGGSKLTQQNMWSAVLPYFDLPEQFPVPQSNGQQSVAIVLSNYYVTILGPFEEAYRRNIMREQQQRGLMHSRMPSGGQQHAPGSSQVRPGAPNMPPQMASISGLAGNSMNSNLMGLNQASSSQAVDSSVQSASGGQFSTPAIPPTPRLPSHPPSTGLSGAAASLGLPSADSLMSNPAIPQHGSQSNVSFSNGLDVATSALEHGIDRKRKMRESEEADAKRQKTEGPEAGPSVGLERGSAPPIPALSSHVAPTAPPTTTRVPRQPQRRKIEYVPLAREIETAGGRDLDMIQHEYVRASHRPLKDFNEWGQVDIEALTMSLRSRISTELSYALTTFTMLTLMRSSQKDGFPVSHTPDLFEEVLDLLEDVAFDGADDEDDVLDGPAPSSIRTHRELVNMLFEDSTRPFAGLDPRQGMKDPNIGLRQRPGDIVLSVVNILRNLSMTPENQDFLAKHDRLLTIVFRLCNLAPSKPDVLPTAASPALTLSDLITVRKDVVYTLMNIAGFVDLSKTSSHRPQVLRNVRRAFELLSSYLSDQIEAVSPFACMLQSGIPPAMHQPKPPSLADNALEAFTRLIQPDDNRHVLAQSVPSEWLWTLMEALVHRLPVSDSDFQVVMRDVWLSYIEKLVMAIYCIAFLAPPQLKKRIKTDRTLGFTKIMLRLVKKFTIYSPPDVRVYFVISVRRAIESMKLIDDAEDSFDTSQSAMPSLSFGMGYGEHGESRVEKGMGLLSGYQEEITWGLMMQRDVDETMFSELESLVRVG
ncbi:hypothetical protein SCP_0112020 [Sparassis crispa]|uniref:ARID domain-containing protein n=1 Tax=Sparassis crispa TaxID=139825 RepID=A0A401G839_9APHY|nr:hypothetical protein SCP_0112020 [Sparassis crispa]GBE78317.1 hypothetical protein SCP_0112020 [Sparassis crispa]